MKLAATWLHYLAPREYPDIAVHHHGSADFARSVPAGMLEPISIRYLFLERSSVLVREGEVAREGVPCLTQGVDEYTPTTTRQDLLVIPTKEARYLRSNCPRYP